MTTTTNHRKTRAPALVPVLTYLTSNTDRVITLDELSREIPGPTRSGIREAMRRLASVHPKHLERHGATAVTWHSAEREPQVREPDQARLIMLTIVDRKPDGTYLGLDEESRKLYQCRPLEW